MGLVTRCGDRVNALLVPLCRLRCKLDCLLLHHLFQLVLLVVKVQCARHELLVVLSGSGQSLACCLLVYLLCCRHASNGGNA